MRTKTDERRRLGRCVIDDLNDILNLAELQALRRTNPSSLFRHLDGLRQRFLFGVEDHREETSWGGEMRLLLNMQRDDRFLITLVLMGQPELRGLVDRVPQLKQRLGIRYHLSPGERRDNMTGFARPGRYISSFSLARLATGTDVTPSSPSAASAALSWPLPPSISTRSGTIAQVSGVATSSSRCLNLRRRTSRSMA